MLNPDQCQQKTDEEIVKLTLENQNYLAYLVERYEKKLFNYIRRISNVSREEAEDILQEVFIKIYTNLRDFDASLKFSSWAYRITHNQVISNFRKNQARPRSVRLDVNNNILENLASDLDSEKEADIQYLRKNIDQILGEIDVKYREVLVLKFFEGKDYKEISDILKKPMGTVATLINRAKKQFKKEIENQGIKID